MPEMNGEKFPYPKAGVQPTAQDKLNPPNGGPASIQGGANTIYQPEVPNVASTSIYLGPTEKTSGGVNDVLNPNPPKVSGSNKDIYLKDNETV